MRRIQVAYSAEGRLLAGAPADDEGPAHARIMPGGGYLVAEFELRPEHRGLAPADLWPLVSVDVSQAEHRVILNPSSET
jgi:hypothetical protein